MVRRAPCFGSIPTPSSFPTQVACSQHRRALSSEHHLLSLPPLCSLYDSRSRWQWFIPPAWASSRKTHPIWGSAAARLRHRPALPGAARPARTRGGTRTNSDGIERGRIGTGKGTEIEVVTSGGVAMATGAGGTTAIVPARTTTSTKTRRGVEMAETTTGGGGSVGAEAGAWIRRGIVRGRRGGSGRGTRARPGGRVRCMEIIAGRRPDEVGRITITEMEAGMRMLGRRRRRGGSRRTCILTAAGGSPNTVGTVVEVVERTSWTGKPPLVLRVNVIVLLNAAFAVGDYRERLVRSMFGRRHRSTQHDLSAYMPSPT